jgi:hypothetical protein
MSKYKINTRASVGEVSSKYGYANGGDLFEADMQARIDRSEYLWGEFKAFMIAHDVTPPELRGMFTKYYEEFLQ